MKEIIQKAYDAIGSLTPLRQDCGALCGAACCQPDETGKGGVYLFPGEAADFQWGDVETGDPFAPMLVCRGMCQRDKRPLACRIFPLTPVVGKDGKWTVRMDVRARPLCPLARGGVRGLDPDFVKAARKAIRLIAEDPEGEAFLQKWAALEEEYRRPLFG